MATAEVPRSVSGAEAEPGDPKRVALVIGNSSYSKKKLDNPVKDAKDIVQALKEIKFQVIDGYDLGRDIFHSWLDAFAKKARDADVAIFYFAGHAFQRHDVNYLCPIGAVLASPEHIARETVHLMRDVVERISGAKIRLVILDACRDNPYEENWPSETRGVGARGLAPPHDSSMQGIKILYSTKHGMTASDGHGKENSPFTSVLKVKLLEPDLSLSQMIDEVCNEVHKNTNHAQEPMAYGRLSTEYKLCQSGIVPYLLKGLEASDNLHRLGAAARVADSLRSEKWQESKAAQKYLEKRLLPEEEDDEKIRNWIKRALSHLWVPTAEHGVLVQKAERVDVLESELAGKQKESAERDKQLRELRARSGRQLGRRHLVGGCLGVVMAAAIAWGSTALVDPPWDTPSARELGLLKPELGLLRSELGLLKSFSFRAFKDCPECPEMAVIPAGSFMMGSSAEEQAKAVEGGADKDKVKSEGPQHRVTIAEPFAVGRYEVTFAEWDACVKEGGCSTNPLEESKDRSRRPVVSVSWDNITQEYLPWLKLKTDKEYRLLSEAEWEYAARGITNGTAGLRYSWDDEIGEGMANCDGCGSYWDKKQSAPVWSFPPNPFGLFNMHGNVWEWVEDFYFDSYNGAPLDGSARTSGQSSERVVRGGSWNNHPAVLRSASRGKDPPHQGFVVVGFRVARALP